MLRISLLLLIILKLSFCGFSQEQKRDDSLIYATIIKSIIPASAKLVLIIDETVKYDHPIDTASIVDSNSTDPNEILTRKYEWEIATKTPFDSISYRPMVRYYIGKHDKLKTAYHFSFPFKIVYISGKEYEENKETVEYWNKLDRKYPNAAGIVSFSQIFYSTDKSRAIVYYSVRRKKGNGSVLSFQRINESWKVIFESKAWYN